MENSLCNIKKIRTNIKNFDFKISKTLGQNFLINKDISSKIVISAGINKDVCVLEIGSGLGALTFDLALRAKKVVAIEMDKKLIPALNFNLRNFKNIKIINEDIQRINLKKLIKDEFSNATEVLVCANIPYYLTSAIIMRFLEEKINVKSLTLMMQKEAALRIVALPGSRECGAISVAVRYFCEPKILFDVSRGNFFPAPKVDSCVVNLQVKEHPSVNVKSEKLFFKLVKVAFSERRKAIKNPLSTRTSFSKQEILQSLKDALLSPLSRAEHLSIEDFSRLSNSLFELTYGENNVF